MHPTVFQQFCSSSSCVTSWLIFFLYQCSRLQVPLQIFNLSLPCWPGGIHLVSDQSQVGWDVAQHLLAQSCGWGLVNSHSCPQFWRSKKNSNSTVFVGLYFGVLEQTKPLQPIGQAAEFKFESKFKPLPTSAGHLAITPKGYSRRQSKDLTAKSMAKLVGPRSGTAWAGVSKLAAQAPGLDLHTWGKRATTLAILTQFEN